MQSVLNPYLHFNGDCRQAMEFYQSVFGGELKMQSFGDTGMPTTPEQKDKIMHADLKNGLLSFMASDSQPEYPVVIGSNIDMCLAGTDGPTLTEYFNKLAQGGQVTLPLAKRFWGDTFGMLTDQFGVNWMVNIGIDGPK